LVELVGIALFDGDGILGTVPQAGAEAVAEVVRDQPGLAVDDLNRPLGTGRHAQPATVAFVFIDSHNFTDH
jgi:hypothetical protein